MDLWMSYTMLGQLGNARFNKTDTYDGGYITTSTCKMKLWNSLCMKLSVLYGERI